MNTREALNYMYDNPGHKVSDGVNVYMYDKKIDQFGVVGDCFENPDMSNLISIDSNTWFVVGESKSETPIGKQLEKDLEKDEIRCLGEDLTKVETKMYERDNMFDERFNNLENRIIDNAIHSGRQFDKLEEEYYLNKTQVWTKIYAVVDHDLVLLYKQHEELEKWAGSRLKALESDVKNIKEIQNDRLDSIQDQLQAIKNDHFNLDNGYQENAEQLDKLEEKYNNLRLGEKDEYIESRDLGLIKVTKVDKDND